MQAGFLLCFYVTIQTRSASTLHHSTHLCVCFIQPASGLNNNNSGHTLYGRKKALTFCWWWSFAPSGGILSGTSYYIKYDKRVAMETTQDKTTLICKQGGNWKKKKLEREDRQICSLRVVVTACYVTQAKSRWVHWVLYACMCGGERCSINLEHTILDLSVCFSVLSCSPSLGFFGDLSFCLSSHCRDTSVTQHSRGGLFSSGKAPTQLLILIMPLIPHTACNLFLLSQAACLLL